MALTNEHKHLLNTRIQEIRLGVQDKRKKDRSIGIVELISIDTTDGSTSTIIRSAYLMLMRHSIRKVCASMFNWTTDQSDTLFATHFEKEVDHLINTKKAELFLDKALGYENLQEVWNSAATLGWIHQFWHRLDKNALNGLNQIQAKDIPFKTQLFSEQYMVDWLLQNTIGRIWLSICQHNRWDADVEIGNTFKCLKRKRSLWKSHSKLDIAIQLETELEQQWGYFVESEQLQPSTHLHSIRDLKLLDPACGTGHFLITAMTMLFSLYKEEARLRGKENHPEWSTDAIVQSIAKYNLHGLDIDPKVLQVARCSLAIRARQMTDTPVHFQLATPNSANRIVQSLGTLHKSKTLQNKSLFQLLNRPNSYDLVVGNPPYLAVRTLESEVKSYLVEHYPKAKRDLYSCFMERCLELLKPNGLSGLITMRGWMFTSSFSTFRTQMLNHYRLLLLGDLDIGAFPCIDGDIVSVAMSIFAKEPPSPIAVAIQSKEFILRESNLAGYNKAGLLGQYKIHPIHLHQLQQIPESPLVYWWSSTFIERYLNAAKVKDISRTYKGIDTGDNLQFVRKPWEVHPTELSNLEFPLETSNYMPLVMGSKGSKWFEPVQNLIVWKNNGQQLKQRAQTHSGSAIRSPQFFGQKGGLAFSTIGNRFSVRRALYPSIYDSPYLFGGIEDEHLLSLNSTQSSQIMSDLNPTVNFTNGDVQRLPLFTVRNAEIIVGRLKTVFWLHEKHRETSIEFLKPGPSNWHSTQEWAQQIIDGRGNESLPEYEPVTEYPSPFEEVSYAVGVALGRFRPNRGVLNPDLDDLSGALPSGFLFLDGTLQPTSRADGLGHSACRELLNTWGNVKTDLEYPCLRDYLQNGFFEQHRKMYHNRPIHWPLSSQRRTFVVWVTIHRISEDFFTEIISTLEARIKTLKRCEEPLVECEELEQFIATLNNCLNRGPENTNPQRIKTNAQYKLQLDDGVLVNSAPLWPVLKPQWSNPTNCPEIWWNKMCSDGPKNLDWSVTAGRYFER